MVRVLHVLGSLNLGGAESRIMDLYRHMDRDKVQFDFLVHMDEKEYARALKEGVEPEQFRKPEYYDEQIMELGGHIYALPRYKVYNTAAYKKAIKRFFTAHHDYTVVQGHMTSTASIYLPIAKACSMIHRDERPADGTVDDEALAKEHTIVTVAHTRNAGVSGGLKGFATKTLRKSLPSKADFLFACSHLAGDATFGGAPYTYIPNTIDTRRFEYSEADRTEIRGLYDIPETAVVIGNVARFDTQKNHKYLISAFASMIKDNSEDSTVESIQIGESGLYLMLCGDGRLKDECSELAAELGIADKVIFTGNQSEVWKYYSAMDVFAFPSVYEGLPGVMVEAQASGLRCLMSDTITEDVLISEGTSVMSIEGPAETWGRKLLETVGEIREDRRALDGSDRSTSKRQEFAAQVRNAGFDVNDQALKMQAFYLKPCRETLPG